MTKSRGYGDPAQGPRAQRLVRQAQPGLILPESFVRGIRHLGYRSSLEALAELIDNALQAYAERIDIVFGFTDGGSSSKPSSIAVLDNGHGMGPEMMRYALMWGGTHRENDRSGLGRFGYGLPCATVSMGRRFTIYSKVRGGKVHSLRLDVDLLERGLYVDRNGEIALPPAKPAILPPSIKNAISTSFPDGWRAGTIVVVEKLDRLEWVTASAFTRNARSHFGVVYHKLLRDTVLHVNGEQVAPIDPLFLTEGALLHALDDDRAQPLDTVSFAADDLATGRSGEVTLRYSWLPPSFAAKDKFRDAIGINANGRFAIMKRYHGVVFSRNGRVIDVQPRAPWTTFINNDRYIRVEVEFSAALDEAFGVTTSKQQVTVSSQMWDRLQVAGMPKAIEQLRMKVRKAKAARRTSAESPTSSASSKTLSRRDQTAVEAQPSTGPGVMLRDIRAPIGAADHAFALRLLLQMIENRLASAAPPIRMEYQILLRAWSKEAGRRAPT